MEKKISTKEEQAIDWLKSEIEKDKVELEAQKKRLIESIKGINKEDIVKPVETLTLWQKIKKVLLT
jgi:F0F1-type ATP synthase membrane subunit b/b'